MLSPSTQPRVGLPDSWKLQVQAAQSTQIACKQLVSARETLRWVRLSHGVTRSIGTSTEAATSLSEFPNQVQKADRNFTQADRPQDGDWCVRFKQLRYKNRGRVVPGPPPYRDKRAPWTPLLPTRGKRLDRSYDIHDIFCQVMIVLSTSRAGPGRQIAANDNPESNLRSKSMEENRHEVPFCSGNCFDLLVVDRCSSLRKGRGRLR